jgi:bla regulator protein blaR1
MTWLVSIGLINAAVASILALIAWGAGRCCRRPALTRLLWIIVLGKLVAPPLAKAPVGDWLPAASRWFPETATECRNELEIARAEAEPATRGAAVSASEAASFESRDTATIQPGFSPVAEKGRGVPRAGESGGVRGDLLTISPARLVWMAAIVWIAGSMGCLLWLAFRVWRFRDFLAWAAVADAEASRHVAHLAKNAGLRSSPQVFLVEGAVSPMLWGAGRRAKLLFPAQLIRQLDGEACDSLLLHELAHYARRDWLVRLLELVTLVVYWWHPLVWWARREIEAVEEECCDAWVLSHQSGSRRTYAEALLTTVDFLCEPIRLLPPAACGLGAAPLLRARLAHIMCGDVALHPSRLVTILVFTGAAVVLPLSPTLMGRSSHEAAARSITVVEIPLPVAIEQSESLKSATIVETELDQAKSKHWYIPREPTQRVSPVLYAAAVSPDGRHKLEARTGNRATLINLESAIRLDLSSYRIVAASFSPDSNRFVTAQDDDNMLRLWDRDGGLLARISGSDFAIYTVAFSPDGELVAAGAADGSVFVWDVSGTAESATLLARYAGAAEAPASCLRWSKDGDRLAIAFSEWSNRDASLLAVWYPATNVVKKELRLEHSIGAIDWLNNDEMVVADWDGDTKFIDIEAGILVGSQRLGKDTISAAAFSPDCPLLPRWQAGPVALRGE